MSLLLSFSVFTTLQPFFTNLQILGGKTCIPLLLLSPTPCNETRAVVQTVDKKGKGNIKDRENMGGRALSGVQKAIKKMAWFLLEAVRI